MFNPLTNLWHLFLFQPLLNLLIWLYQTTGNFGWAIIILTVGLRVAMTPLVIPSLKVSKKMQELAPELSKLKEKFKGDKTGLATAQAELYKQHGINPASGCLPQIIQIIVLIALFNAFNLVLRADPAHVVTKLIPEMYAFNKLSENFVLSTKFFAWDLIQPDVYKVVGLPFALPGILLLVSAAIQLISAVMMMPVISEEQRLARKTSEDTDDVMAATQEQMVYMFPLMTILFGYQFPAGLVLYWLIFSLASVIQQYLVSGWGGLAPWLTRFNLLKSPDDNSHSNHF